MLREKKNIWLGLWKVHVLLFTSGFIATNTAGKCPDVSLKTVQYSLKMPTFFPGNWADFFVLFYKSQDFELLSAV